MSHEANLLASAGRAESQSPHRGWSSQNPMGSFIDLARQGR